MHNKSNFQFNCCDGEHHLIYHISINTSISMPFRDFKNHLNKYFSENNLSGDKVVYCKLFTINDDHFSQLKNTLLSDIDDDKIVQIYQKPLLAEVSVLLYINNSKLFDKNKIKVRFNRFAQNGKNIEEEISKDFKEFDNYLKSNKLNFFDNTIRSWIYVNNIDEQYKYIVEERGKYFIENNINESNRYLASTGIGASISSNQNCQTDYLFFEGIDRSNIMRMVNHDIMPDTLSYGVHFERGLQLNLPNKKHFYISGTASIMSDGNVSHINDINKQTEHAILNCDNLLKKYESSINDFTHCIVYIRELNHFNSVYDIIRSHMAQIPLIIVHGAVCRPTWLIELEGTAIKQINV